MSAHLYEHEDVYWVRLASVPTASATGPVGLSPWAANSLNLEHEQPIGLLSRHECVAVIG